jgi:hypothetical protein
MAVISMKQLLEAGVHFGHQTRRWNPKRLVHHLLKLVSRSCMPRLLFSLFFVSR